MAPRRSHRKSRLGCIQCKRRKIKCDETPPPCGNCRRHDIECEYAIRPETRTHTPESISGDVGTTRISNPQLPAGNVQPHSHLSVAPTTTTTPTTSTSSADQLDIFSTFMGTNLRFTSDLHLHDLELMHQYTTQTYRTLSNNNEHEEIWKDIIPKEALEHPFLMHGLLALAALHLIECNPDENETRRKYIELATMHQHLAVSAFRPELSNITISNCNAVFAFSSLIAVLSFAFSRFVGTASTGEPVAEVLQDFFLFRGVEGVLTSFFDFIQRGKLGTLVRRAENTGVGIILSKDIIDTLDYLHGCNSPSATHSSAEEKQAYNYAIRELRISFERPPLGWETVFRWPVVLPESYLALLKSRKPMALVILAHYCVILRRLDACWWSKGWSHHLFKAIYRSLDISWAPLLKWPMQMIEYNENMDGHI